LEADFTSAKAVSAKFDEENLSYARFLRADLRNADLRLASMVHTDLRLANISQSLVFGVSAWRVKLCDTLQEDLIITEYDEPVIRVDGLEVAQFIHLILHNRNLRNVIDVIGNKAILIVGRFSEQRKAALNAVKTELRQRGYVPIIFDFEKPRTRDMSETLSLLAHMSRFIVADLTDARSVPHELQLVVPNLPSVPVQPVIHHTYREYALFEHIKRYPWVLPIYVYRNTEELIKLLTTSLLPRAEAAADDCAGAKAPRSERDSEMPMGPQ
jgi:uncharacterized protein YjbI with pentapeptide repeats